MKPAFEDYSGNWTIICLIHTKCSIDKVKFENKDSGDGLIDVSAKTVLNYPYHPVVNNVIKTSAHSSQFGFKEILISLLVGMVLQSKNS